MQTTTDIVIAVLLSLFFYKGWKKGLLHALIGPICLIICSVFGIIHYDLTHDIFKSLLVATVGSVIVSLLLRTALFLGRMNVNKEERKYVFWGSRLTGAVLNTAWKGGVIAMFIILLALLPERIPGLTNMRNDLKRSVTYTLINRGIIQRVTPIKNISQTFSYLQDPEHIRQLSTTKGYTALFSDPAVQDFFSDPEIIELVQKKELVRLWSHPKLLEMLNDPELLKKIGSFGIKAGEELRQK